MSPPHKLTSRDHRYFTTTTCQPKGDFTLDPAVKGGQYVPADATVVLDEDFKPDAVTCENAAIPAQCVGNHYVCRTSVHTGCQNWVLTAAQECYDGKVTAYFGADANLPNQLTEVPSAEPVAAPVPGCKV